MKYVISTLVFIVLLAGSIFFISEQNVNAGYEGYEGINEQQLTLTLLGPYGQKIANDFKHIGNENNRGYMGSRELTPVTVDFESDMIARNTRLHNKEYCGEGGGEYYLSYYINVKISKHGDPFVEEKRISPPVYSCLTTKDLLKTIHIPQEWESSGDTLLVYCSEPGKQVGLIENDLAMSSFLFSQLNDVHIACLIRNEDTQESVVYGFPYGNKKLEKSVRPFIDESKENPISIAQGYELLSSLRINDNSQMMELEKEISANTNEKIYLSFFNESSKPYFILTQDSSYLSNQVSLSSVFDLGKIADETSRMVMLRKFEHRTIYGFQTQEELISRYSLPEDIGKTEGIDRKLNPIYVINYDGFGSTQETCMNTLKMHNPSKEFLDKTETTVVCLPDTIFLQPSNLNSNPHTDDLGFTLFKNIITKANGDGAYEVSYFYDIFPWSFLYRQRDTLYPDILDPPEPLEVDE